MGGLLALVLAFTAEPLPGVEDHPLISRYAGSTLINASSEGYASLRVPLSGLHPGPGGALVMDKSVTVEGALHGYLYVAPQDREALEVFRNYEAALTHAGFRTLFRCEDAACDKERINENYGHELVDPRRWVSGRLKPRAYGGRLWFSSHQATVSGRDVYVLVWVKAPDSVFPAVTSFLTVVEPKPMDEGQVVVSLEALQRGLETEGRVALTGLFFDLGLAVVKPESRPQLEQMAKLLAAQPALKVFIVGHTDDQGALASNLTLSQKRAEAVVDALVKGLRVSPTRLEAHGVANFAPLTANRTEAGRARNRRVELVAQ